MKFTAGETVTIEMENDILEVKIEDASKGDVVSARVENVLRGQTYKVGEVYEFDRANLKSRDN